MVLRTFPRLVTALSLIAGVIAASVVMSPKPADATIHEMVAAYCSGGGVGAIDDAGFLEAPGVSGGGSAQSFARPVIATGILDPFPIFSDHPAAKFPEGTFLFTLKVSEADHPSAAHCPKAQDLP